MSNKEFDTKLQELARKEAGETVTDRMTRLGLSPEKSFKEGYRKTQMDDLEEANLLVDDATFEKIASALIISKEDSILLPPGRYDHCSRGKGWCRKGRGDSAMWGEQHKNGYVVHFPGLWVIGSSDGFKRKNETKWQVSEVTVGSATWMLAE